VSGIVGACGDNAQGVIGVAGGTGPGTGVQMMALGVGTAAPDGNVLDDAIIYAADMGARVITMSLSVGQSAAIDAAIDYAYTTMGVFINNASGNENSGVNYPATDPDVVAVGATDHNDNRKTPPGWGSNFGPELEVVAPGVDIWSTRLGNTYGSGGRTSFASPHVAGTAALMFSINPAATNAEVRQCIIDTAEDQVGDPAEDTAGRDDFYGHGRLNTEEAINCIRINTVPIADANGPYSEECEGTTTAIQLDATGSSDPDTGDTLTFSWTTNCPGSFDDAGSSMPVLTVDTSDVCVVSCSVNLTVTDMGGDTDSDSSTVSISDTTAPQVTSCPADTTIECDESTDPGNTGSATATDVCDPTVEISHVDAVSPGACPEESVITRMWTAADSCENEDESCVQTINIADTTAPDITCPADITIECDESTDPDNTGSATATDACDSDPVIDFSDVITPSIVCPEEKVITRTWTATDGCGNSNDCEQIITVDDSIPPVISCNTPATITPPDAPVSFTATAVDNCDGDPEVVITEYDCYKFTKKGKRIDKTESCIVELTGDSVTVVDSGGVGDHITWEIKADDNCGNSAVKSCEVEVIKPHK
jgi:hypothetical protein